MNRAKLKDAITAANAFISAAALAYARLQADGLDIYNNVITGTKETAAARRASMDLTRALSRLRSRHD